MIVVRDTETLKGKRQVATIGFFDGVHLGHRFLIHELKQVAEAAGLPSAVITFPEHPRAVLHADYQPKLLNSFEEKLKHLGSTGIAYCKVLDFTLELSRLTAKEFITTVKKGDYTFETNAFVTLIHGDAKIFLIGSIEIDKLLVRFKENMAQIQKKSKEVFERYFR